MTKRDDKQVQDALQAIKALVESSDLSEGADQDIVTLDHVVWRNPVKEEPETVSETDHLTLASAAEQQDRVSAPSSSDKAVISPSLSVSPHELQSFDKKPVIATDIVKPRTTELPEILKTAPEPLMDPSVNTHLPNHERSTPQADRRAHNQAEYEPAVQELTTPIGRRGGGFYSGTGPSLTPVIKTSKAPMPELPADKAPVAGSQPAPDEQRPTPAQTAPEAKPPLPDAPFHGSDFNFSPAEGLMTAASFEGLEKWPETPIEPEINVPIAEPAVADPAREVQMMFAQTQEEPEEAPFSQPTLHIVSDQTANSYEDDDAEEGFSGTVRMALRSIIKEQVSSWLQGNMTGLIEEALSTPQKPSRRGTKSSSNTPTKKR